MKKWKLKSLIEEEIKAIALSKIQKFYPSYLCNMTGHPLKLIIESLLTFVEEGSVKLYFEYNCEECSRTLNKASAPLSFEEVIICRYCRAENEFKPENGKVCFYLDDGYRAYIRSTFNHIQKKNW